jgi:hypothetical protein
MTAPAPEPASARASLRSPGERLASVETLEGLLADVRMQILTPWPTPGLTLTPVECDQIATALGLGSRPTAASILTAVERLAALHIGDIRIPFTPGQLAELQHRAGKRGRTVEAEMRAVVARVEEELFYKGG